MLPELIILAVTAAICFGLSAAVLLTSAPPAPPRASDVALWGEEMAYLPPRPKGDY